MVRVFLILWLAALPALAQSLTGTVEFSVQNLDPDTVSRVEYTPDGKYVYVFCDLPDGGTRALVTTNVGLVVSTQAFEEGWIDTIGFSRNGSSGLMLSNYGREKTWRDFDGRTSRPVEFDPPDFEVQAPFTILDDSHGRLATRGSDASADSSGLYLLKVAGDKIKPELLARDRDILAELGPPGPLLGFGLSPDFGWCVLSVAGRKEGELELFRYNLTRHTGLLVAAATSFLPPAQSRGGYLVFGSRQGEAVNWQFQNPDGKLAPIELGPGVIGLGVRAFPDQDEFLLTGVQGSQAYIFKLGSSTDWTPRQLEVAAPEPPFYLRTGPDGRWLIWTRQGLSFYQLESP
ncbi:MAG: hypothetical protein AB7S38_05510 [Vulcanimicrobiota bacterium]